MPFDGAGAFSPPGSDFPATTLTTISSTKFNNVINDIAAGLTNSVTRDGQSPWTANIPAGGFKVTGMSAGSARTDSVRAAEVQDGTYLWGGTSGGTANALTFSLAPAPTAYVAGQTFRFKAGATNTGPATVNINGLGVKTLQKNGAALIAGDILQDGLYLIIYDGTNFQTTALSAPAWSTGDMKATFKTTADSGWVMMNDGTIGSATSGGTTRANADTEALFTLLWNNTANADCAVSGGRGASAAADFAANKTIALPKALGRNLAASGTGAGLTARALASALGNETITTSHLPASGLSVPSLSVSASLSSLSVPVDNGAFKGTTTNQLQAVQTNNHSMGYALDTVGLSGGVSGSTGTGTTGNMGTGGQFLNPRVHTNFMVKL